jgi:Leucine-rich repeat (LRR) protein/sugar lactone lactonase YvrE
MLSKSRPPNAHHFRWAKRFYPCLHAILVVIAFSAHADTDCTAVTEIPTAQCETLIDLYNSTDGDNWTANDNWLQNNTPCNWLGITCSGGGVTEIDLNGKGLNGPLPDISALTDLTLVKLYDNALTGPIPDLSALTQLSYLHLYNNDFTGTIPELKTLTQLKNLYLGKNQLTGPVPDFTGLTNLQYIHLQENELTGEISDFRDNTNLRELRLDYNQLTGTIPALTHLTNLQQLRVQANQFTGEIPDLTGLTNLWYLAMSSNQLTGTIPAYFNQLTNLKDLYLHYNQLTGTIPDLSGLANLRTLHLNDNQLTGTVPNEISTLTNLRTLALNSNQLTGTIPDLSQLTGLSYLALSYNQFTGSMPSFKTLTNLKEVYLQGNQFTGNVPDLSSLGVVQKLALHSNKLTGPIPDLSALEKASYLALSGNQLTGTIPDLSKLTRVTELYLHTNQLSGSIPDLSQLTKLKVLYLYNNQLSGSIPDLSQLTNLTILYLQYNQLSGTIPDLSALTHLQKLALHSNKLTGEIPDVSQLNNVWYFAVSYNQLSGNIPDLTGLTKLKELYLHDNLFTGTIPDLSMLPNATRLYFANNLLTGSLPDLSALTKLQSLRIQNNNLSGPIPDMSALVNLKELYLTDNPQLCKDADINYTGRSEVDNIALCPGAEVNLVATTNATACVGQNMAITVTKQRPQTVDGIQIGLTFDPATLKVNSLTGSGVLDTLKNEFDNEAGTVQFAAGNFFSDPVGNDFELVTINVTPLAASSGTPVSFNTEQTVATYNRNDLASDTENLTLAIEYCPESPVTFRCDNVEGITSVQCEVLVALYDNTDGDNWTNNAGWKRTNTPCDWQGLTCDNGEITAIDLTDNNLNGSLPDLGTLSNLQTVALTSNQLCKTPNTDYSQWSALDDVLSCDDPSYGLVLHLPFDGNADDASGNNNDGIVNGATLTTDRHGSVDSAYAFDGQTYRIKLPHSSLNELDTFSMGFWAQTADIGTSKHLVTSANSGQHNEFLIRHDAGKIVLLIKGIEHAFDTPKINDGEWHSVNVVRSSSTVEVFVDGSLAATWQYAPAGQLAVDLSGFWLGGDQDCLGGCWDKNQQFSGIMDEVSLHNRALTASEIQSYYDSTKPATTGCNGDIQLADNLCDGLVAYYPLNDNPNDASGNGNDGTEHTVNYATGVVGNALDLDGTGYIRKENFNFTTEDVSVAMWMNAKNLSSFWYRYFFAIHSGGDGTGMGDKNIGLEVHKNGPALRGVLTTEDGRGAGSASDHVYLLTESNIESNQWYHVALVRQSGGLQKLYVNGVRVDAKPEKNVADQFFVQNGFLEIGAPNYWEGGWEANGRDEAKWQGLLDEVYLYNRELTDSEIQALYNAGGLATPPQTGCNDDTQRPDNLCDGLIAFYPLDGNANEVSGNADNGTVDNATLTTDRFGNANSAYSFDSTSKITAPNIDGLRHHSQFSVGAWIKRDSEGTGIIVEQGTGCADMASVFKGKSFHVAITTQNQVQFSVNSGTGIFYEASNEVRSNQTIMPDSEWHFVTGVFDNGEITVYIDGVKDTGKTVYFDDGVYLDGANGKKVKPSANATQFTQMADSSEELYIGSIISYCGTSTRGVGYPYGQFKGAIDDVQMYNRVLTDAEIQALYNAANPVASETVLEDAEDGSTGGWQTFEERSGGAAFENVFDSEINSRVIEFTGDSRSGYALTKPDGSAFSNTTDFIAQWRIKTAPNTELGLHTFTWGVKTSGSVITISYHTGGISGCRRWGTKNRNQYVSCGLDGSRIRDGKWHTITRDLEADLKAADSSLELQEVRGISTRTAGRVDDIQLLNRDAVNFYTISGTITDENGQGMSDTPIMGATCQPSDSQGNFECTVPEGWVGGLTISTQSDDRFFAPVTRSYSEVSENITDQNFTAKPIRDGLLGHWTFDDCDAKDNSGNDIHGVIYGAPKCVDGIQGKGLSFNGIDESITVDGHIHFAGQNITTTAWVYIEEATKGSVVFKYDWLHANGINYSMGTGGLGKYANTIGMRTESAKDDEDIGKSYPRSENEQGWVHLAMVLTPESQKLYANGELKEEVITLPEGFEAYTGPRPLEMAGVRHNSEHEFFNSVMDEVRLYNRALSASEIQALYNAANPVASETVLEDAEDGNTEGWFIYDKKEKYGANFANVFDSDINSNVIELTGNSWSGYKRTVDNTTNFIARWRMKTASSDGHTIYWNVKTSGSVIYMEYRSDKPLGCHFNSDSTYVTCGLDDSMRDQTWHTITRDLEADLKSVAPELELQEVLELRMRMAGRLDDIQLLNRDDVNFHTISGTITDNGKGVSGLSLSNSGADCQPSNSDGKFTCTVPEGWFGTLAPEKSDTRFFAPITRAYSEVSENLTDQNFTAKPINNGLLGYWNFNNCDASDNSGNGFDGIIHSEPSCVDGVMGKGLQFDGTDDFIEINGGEVLSNPVITVAGWAYKKSDTKGIVVHKVDHLYRNGDNYVLNPGRGKTEAITGQDLDVLHKLGDEYNDQWVHTAFVLTTEDMAVYVNGELKNQKNLPDGVVPHMGSAPLQIGGTPLSNHGSKMSAFFNSVIDEVYVYNRALSDAEIQQLANPKRPVAHYCFDDPDNLGNDCSGNEQHATPKNGVTASANGGALFDGEDDYFAMSLNAKKLEKAFTAIALFKPEVQKKQVIFWFKDDQPSIGMLNHGGIYFGYRQNGSYPPNVTKQQIAGSHSVNIGDWNCVAYTYDVNDDRTMRFYLNGFHAGYRQLETDFLTRDNADARIGVDDGTGLGRFFNGEIDEVQFYNYVLSEEEIQTRCPPKPNPEKLVAHYCFDDPDNLGKNCHADEKHGTPQNGVSSTDGKIGTAALLDGKDDIINLPDFNPLFMGNAFTVTAWFKPNEIKERNEIVWFQDDQPAISLTHEEVLFKYKHGDDATHRIVAHKVDGNQILPLGEWNCAVYTYDAYDNQTAKMYLNGNQLVEKTLEGYFVPTQTGLGRIGGDDNWDHGRAFNGAIDDVRIYNYALSDEDIQALCPAPSVTMLEDAEDGNTDDWSIYENKGGDSAVSTVFDDELNSQVIEFSGSNWGAYKLSMANGSSFGNTTNTVAQWRIKKTEGYYDAVYWRVKTSGSVRYLVYRDYVSLGCHLSDDPEYVNCGIDISVKDGEWHTIIRDLEADLKAADPNLELLAVEHFQVRIHAKGRVDDIQLLNREALNSYTMTGKITENDQGISGVSFAASGAVCQPSDNNGDFSCTVPAGWFGTLVPEKDGYLFEPFTRVYRELSTDMTAQHFTAKPIPTDDTQPIVHWTRDMHPIEGNGAVHLPYLFSDYVDENFTVTVRAKPTAIKSINYIFHANDDYPSMRLDGANRLRFAFTHNGTAQPRPISQTGSLVSEALPLNEWIEAAVTWDGTNFVGYVNGKRLGSATLPKFIQGNRVAIGWDGGTNRHFEGEIAEVKIYKRALTFFSDCNSVTEIPTAQCEALVALYDSTNGNNWMNNDGWKTTDTPCSWYGIECSDGNITKISLEDNQLTGTIPELSNLTGLRDLRLFSNQLTGSIPELSALTQLQILFLNNNQLTGQIPELSALTELQRIYLALNKLTGPVPELTALTQLIEIDFGHNQLTGTIPELSNLTNLEVLSLKYNDLSGEIPELSHLSQLDKLRLEGNNLTGSIPDLSGLSSLTGLVLAANQLTGEIPDLSGLTSAHSIYLGDNQLTGSIPDLSQVTNLWNFSVANNQLSGEIPSLSSLPRLESFDLSGNENQFCRNPDADYVGRTEIEAFETCADVKLIAEANTTQACIGQNLTIMINKQLAQTVNEIQMALSYDANLFKVNSITNAGPLAQFNANFANGTAQITAGNFTGVGDEFAIATLQLTPLATSVGTTVQFNDSQTAVKLNGAPLRHESQGTTLAIKDCVSEVIIQPEAHSAIWTLVEETQAIEQTGENLDAPKSISFDASGNAYIADSLNHRILKRDTQGNLSVVAGTGKRGKTGDDGPAIEAKLNNPQGIAVDEEGNLYIADTNNHRIRKVDSNGIITTIAGIGKGGYAGDNGLATAAKLKKPTAIVFDNNGHLYITDSGNHRIRKVSGQRTRKPSANSLITTVAGDGRSGYRGDNGPATGARLNNPTGLAVDNQNNLYIADTDNHRIRKVDLTGTITTVAGNGMNGYSGDGDPATAAQINAPTGLEVDSTGNLYIADRNNHRIRKVDNEGIITTFTGTGKRGTATDGILAEVAQINQPSDVALDQYGNLYIADKGNDTIRKIGEKDGEEDAAEAPPHQIADCPNTEVTGIPENECYALVAFYDSTKGPEWTNNDGWKATDTPCQWKGVTCQDGHVIAIDLPNNNLVGDVPPQIGALINLQELNLNDNQISGAIPTTIEHLNNLTTLNLANNALTGSLPMELGDATSLQTVNLANNQISGAIPDLNALTKLQTLNLSENLLNGPVPDLTDLPALQTLDISGDDQQVCQDSDTDYGNLPVGNLDECPTDNQLPIAAFTATPNKGEAPLTVNLDARSSYDPYGNITVYVWETSDAQILMDATPTITFQKSGTYEIRLRVLDHDGAPSINVATRLIEVSPGPDQVTLNLDKDGMGLGTVYIRRDKESALTCNAKCQAESEDYPQGSEIKLTARAVEGSLFTGWRGDCVGTEENNRIQITMDSPKHCTAVFELEQNPPSTMHALTIDSVATMGSGGTIEVKDIVCHEPPCKSYHPAEQQVKITGTPSPHAYFIGWNLDCPVLGEYTDATNLVVLTKDTTCIAYFGNDSDIGAVDTAKEFEQEAELYTGESVTEIYPPADNRERYEQAFRVAEKAMMTVEDQMLLDGNSWPDHFNDIKNWFDPLPDNLYVETVQIKSGENVFDDGALIIGDYVHVEVSLLSKFGDEELVSILVYYDEKPTVEYPTANTRRRKGSRGYACWRRR